MTDDIQRTLGEHEAEISGLKTDMAEVKADVKTILATVNQARGSWRIIVALTGLSGALGALLTKFWPFHS